MRGPCGLSGAFRGAVRKAGALVRRPSEVLPHFFKGIPKGATLKGASLSDAAASISRRAAAANQQLGEWALREAPPAFRFRGNKYGSYPGAPQKEGPLRSPMEQQKKANLMSVALVLSAAAILIFTPLYLNSLYGKQRTKPKPNPEG